MVFLERRVVSYLLGLLCTRSTPPRSLGLSPISPILAFLGFPARHVVLDKWSPAAIGVGGGNGYPVCAHRRIIRIRSLVEAFIHDLLSTLATTGTPIGR